MQQGDKFFLRMASKPHHERAADFKPFSAFLPAKISTHAVVISALYHETDVTAKVVDLYDTPHESAKPAGATCGQEDDHLVFTNFNELFGDVAPGVPKQLTVAFWKDGCEHSISATESEWMRIPRPGKRSEKCPDYDDFGDWTWGIQRATFGPRDVTEPLRGILCDFGGKVDMLKRFGETGEGNLGEGDVFGDPTPGEPKKLIVEFSDGSTRTWEGSSEVRLDVSDWKPAVEPSPARAGAGRGVALAKASRMDG